MTVSDLNVSDDTVVAVHPDEDEPARRPLLSGQRSWNALTCNFPTGTCRLERVRAVDVPAVPLERVRQGTVGARVDTRLVRGPVFETGPGSHACWNRRRTARGRRTRGLSNVVCRLERLAASAPAAARSPCIKGAADPRAPESARSQPTRPGASSPETPDSPVNSAGQTPRSDCCERRVTAPWGYGSRTDRRAPASATGGRRVTVRGIPGLAYSDHDLVVFLADAGLLDPDLLLDDPAWVEWRGERAHQRGSG
ncbi:hypothetical protein JHY03_68620 (plasmid) [Streptomyces sp. CA-256286]|nr:hypothetical protein JHY03_68620 [Streptomyces sp. CA-256286]